jgi:hypothetical protein
MLVCQTGFTVVSYNGVLEYWVVILCYSVIKETSNRQLFEFANVIVVVLLLCTFSVIQWVIVLFWCTFSIIQWVIVLYWCTFPVIQWVIVLFWCTFSVIQWIIVLLFMYIFSHSVSHRPVFYEHFQSFSELSSCFLCTFSVIQWVMVLFLCTVSVIQWIIVLFSYVHFQSFSEASSYFEEFHYDLLAFIIIIAWYIFRTSGIQCPVWRCYWRSTWSNNYCNDHFRDPILHEKER